MLQKGLEPCHGVVVPPCERAGGLSATSKLWACTSWEVRGRKLGELPGHPGPDGVARKKKNNTWGTWRGVAKRPEDLPMVSGMTVQIEEGLG